MSFDLEALREAVAKHGTVWRVVVAKTAGSVPREAGASMLVWADGQSGTIGGGALEYQAAERARGLKGPLLERLPLGPGLGQCCGGSVMLLYEQLSAGSLERIGGAIHARSTGDRGEIPLAVKRLLAAARSQGQSPAPQLIEGWMVEPIAPPKRDLWVWGAGHVGRAVISVMAPLPDFRITWVDTAPTRFPDALPEGVTQLIAADPANLVAYAPPKAEHLVLTYSHALDLELCHRLLTHGFAHAGLIGSATKWARFRARLSALGHSPTEIARIQCPIGAPNLGKHPQAIAVGVASALLIGVSAAITEKERAS